MVDTPSAPHGADGRPPDGRSPDDPPGDAVGQRGGAPGYDTSKERYAGISSGALDDPDDVRAARDFAEMIVDTVREGLLVLDLDLRVEAANESFYDTFEVDPEETVGRKVYDLGNGQWDIAELRELLEGILPHEKAFNDYEVDHEFEELGRRQMLLNARRLDDHELILLAVEDVTERRRDRGRADRQLDMFGAALGTFEDFVYVLTPDVRFTYANRALLDLWGLGIDDVVGKGFAELGYPPDLVALHGRQVAEVIATRQPVYGENAYVSPSGQEGYYEYIFSPVFGEGGAVEAIAGITRDVTERRRAADALRESEERYRLLFEAMGEGFALCEVIWDDEDRPVDWRFLEVNPAWSQTGVAVREAVGRTAREVNPDIEPEWIETYGRVVRTGEPIAFEAYAAGLGKWFATHAFKHSENRFGLLFLDVTERKRAEESLARERAQLETILETLPAGLIIADAEGRVIHLNAAAREIWGIPPETTSWEEYGGWVGWWPETGERIQAEEWAMARALLHGEITVGELVQSQKFGGEERRYFLNNAAPVRDGEGRITGGVVAMLDVTERVGMEAALKELNEHLEERVEERTREVQEREAKLRELSRALTLAEQEERRRIAHVLHDDLQQVLFGAKLAAHSLGTNSGDADGDAGGTHLEDVLDEALELTRTLSHSLSPPLLEGEDVEDLLVWLAERHRMLYGLEVEVVAGGDVPVPDRALRVLLYQVVRELLFNVAKHSGVERARVVAERRFSGADECVRVAVEDDGAGFDPAKLEEASNAGLGLPSVRERLELVGGELEVASAPGEGTRVTITVPLTGGTTRRGDTGVS